MYLAFPFNCFSSILMIIVALFKSKTVLFAELLIVQAPKKLLFFITDRIVSILNQLVSIQVHGSSFSKDYFSVIDCLVCLPGKQGLIVCTVQKNYDGKMTYPPPVRERNSQILVQMHHV